jgi:hypothetical protein
MDNSRINDYVRQLWNANSAEHIRTILNKYHEELSKLLTASALRSGGFGTPQLQFSTTVH